MVNLLKRAESARPVVQGRALLTAESQQLLARRLAEAQRWWLVSRCFRTAALEPDLEEEPTLAALDQALGELAEARQAAVQSSGACATESEPAGRLLVCEIGMSIGDGVSQAASEGFFDADDRPPWECWLVCFGRTRPSQPDQPIECMVAWVPQEWEALAEAGIAANTCMCLYWLDGIA